MKAQKNSEQIVEGDEEDEKEDDEEEKVDALAAAVANLHISEPGEFTYENLVQGLKTNQYKKIMVMTGAGISVSAGIPDFRSPGTGIYDNLAEYNLPTPEAIFAIDYFLKNPAPFYKFA